MTSGVHRDGVEPKSDRRYGGAGSRNPQNSDSEQDKRHGEP